MAQMKDDLLATIRERFKLAQDAERDHHERATEDLMFLTGEGQWPEEERRWRESNNRPVLTFNLLNQSVERVKAQIRDTNPAIKVSAADGDAHEDIAEIYEGLVRQIEYASGAASIYEAAAESAAACSMGFFRIRTRYCEGETFDQEIIIERVYNPFSSFPDPAAKDPTRKDARFWFLIEEIPLEDFKKLYPKAKTEDFTGDHRPPEFAHWVHGKNVVVAEYFWIEDEEYEIAMMADGSVIRSDLLPPGIKPLRKRKATRPRVKWVKCTGSEILEGPQDVPGRYIPIVAVYGSEYHLGEASYRSSVVRFAKDAQMSYNIARTSAIEVVLLQPKAPFMVTPEQIAGYEEIWNGANEYNRPYLPYNPDPNAPMPSRMAPPMQSSGLMTEAMTAAEDVKRTTGIYDASLGQRSNETSGKAIMARQSEAEAGTSVYTDNGVKAVHHAGAIIVAMVPEVYDAKRALIILGEDGQEKMVTVNDVQGSIDGTQPINDLTLGRYDVRISVGPSYDTKREEAAESLLSLASSVPQIGQLGADIIVKALNIPEGDRLADRLRKALPPGVAEQPEKLTPEEEQAMQAQAMQAQQQQAIQQTAIEVEMRLKAAQAAKAEAEASKANAEAQLTQIEAAQASGQIAEAMNATAQHAAAGAVAALS